jgi:hypothetical protein
MRREIIISVVFLALGAQARATVHTFSLPKDSPAIRVTIPDYLEPTDTLRGAEGGVSHERTFTVLVEPMAGADKQAAAEQCFKMLLDERGNEIDPSSVKQTDRKINGLDATNFSFIITEGVETAGFAMIATKLGADFMAVVYYGSNEGLKANFNAWTTTRDSIQPIKK